MTLEDWYRMHDSYGTRREYERTARAALYDTTIRMAVEYRDVSADRPEPELPEPDIIVTNEREQVL